MRAPYVLSIDIQKVFKNWGDETGYQIPNKAFFDSQVDLFRKNVSVIFDNLVVVEEKTLSQYSQNRLEAAHQTGHPILSLDEVHSKNNALVDDYIPLTRSINESFTSIGYRNRHTGESLDKTIGNIAQPYRGQNVVLFDDVLFSGGSILEVIRQLSLHDVTVQSIFPVIAIKDGIINLQKQGIDVYPAIAYDQVADEICFRDFCLGAPFSGRSLQKSDGTLEGVPYSKPLGMPEIWASIPESFVTQFSDNCLDMSFAIWDQIEKENGCKIKVSQLQRPIYGVDSDAYVTKSIVAQKQALWALSI